MSTGSLRDIITDTEYDIPSLDMSPLKEGLYELVLNVTSIDIESGWVDDWEIKLIKGEVQILAHYRLKLHLM